MQANQSPSKELKLYSLKAIGIATFIGAPLAASVLVRSNYLALGKKEEGRNALLLGILSTLLLFAAIFSLPAELMDKVPNQIIPMVYTGIIIFLVEKIQGEAIKEQEANEKEFNSLWKAAGIGAICLVLIMGPIFGYAFYESSNPAYEIYDQQLEKFYTNESEALAFYDHLNTNSNQSLLRELENRAIPNWEENLEIIQQSNEIENLPNELKERNAILVKYCNLRMEVLKTYQKGFLEGFDKYKEIIDDLHAEIDLTVAALNKN